MTPAFVSRSSIIIFSLVVGVSISTNAETVKVTDKASTDGSFTIAQTNGMNRRQDAGATGRTAVSRKGSARTSATANSKDARRGEPQDTRRLILTSNRRRQSCHAKPPPPPA